MKILILCIICILFSPIIIYSQSHVLETDVEEAINLLHDDLSNYDNLEDRFNKLRIKYLKLSKGKKEFRYYLNLGAIYTEGKLLFTDFNSVDSALYYLVKAKEINPAAPETYNLFGVAYWGIGYYKYSIEHYKRALKYDTKNEYNFCYRGIVSAYSLIRNPHMTLLYSQFLDKNRLENNPVLLKQINVCEKTINIDYPIDVKIDNAGIITYKNNRLKFVAKYPFLWTEANDIPYDSKKNESYLILSLEEIKDKNNEYTLSSIAVIANDSDISFDDYVIKILNEFKRSGKVSKNPTRFLNNSFEFRIINGKFIDTLVFIKGERIKYTLVYSTTSGAFDLDLDKFKLFLKTFEISG